MSGPGDLIVVLLLLALGAFAFVLGVLAMVWRGIARVGRGLLAMVGVYPAGQAGRGALRGVAPRLRLCRNEKCRSAERRAARYCARCGEKL
jgi:hypothetical protein